MERSSFSAQVQFVDDPLALIHIPLDLYPFFLQPILQLLYSDVPPVEGFSNISDAVTPSLPFLNISITPVECSVICSRTLANEYFLPLVGSQDWTAPAGNSRVQISHEDFIVMQVEGQGLDAGQRVLELTSPLAMAGISIFFTSTYFSDYILFPRRCKSQVTQALESRGFNFEDPSDTLINSNQPQYQKSSPPISARQSPPGTPPPPSLVELQNRTFSSLQKHSVRPHVDRTLQVVQCAVHYSEPTEFKSFSVLRPHLVTALLLDKPRFLSLTVTSTDPSPSILLEKRLLPRFSLDLQPSSLSTNPWRGGERLLLGSKDEVLIPIMLDLRDLPLEATGIVCGVAGKMATSSCILDADGDEEKEHEFHLSGTNGDLEGIFGDIEGIEFQREPAHNLLPTLDTTHLGAVEISFLSTARAGTVLVSDRDLNRAMASLEAKDDNVNWRPGK